MAHQFEADDTPANIPPFARSLAPYIRTRQEALQIRQALTSYLRSHIELTNNESEDHQIYNQSHLSLCVPQEAVVNVKRIPSEVTGPWRHYLQALHANVAARKEYRSLSEKSSSAKDLKSATKIQTPPLDPNAELQAYLRLLRDRRRHAKLQVFQHYLQELKERDSIVTEHIDDRPGGSQQIFASEEVYHGSQQQNGRGANDHIEGLVHKLERAVIRAKAQLDREKKLLEEMQAQHVSRSEDIPSSVKVMALQRTRDELVQWVEERLVSVGSTDDGPLQEISPEEIAESTHMIEEQKAQIAAQYAAYVEARKRLLDTAARACQPVTMVPVKSSKRSIDLGKLVIEGEPALKPLEVLSFASDHLVPLSKTQRALALQKNYLSAMLAKEKSTTLRILNRLSDESHLLPEYPLLAQQPRLKHVNPRHMTGTTDVIKSDEVVTLAEAWTFASEAAGANEQHSVEERLAEGQETAAEAEQVLKEVYSMLNQNLEQTLREAQRLDDSTTNIWASGTRSTRSRARTLRTERQPSGPWTKLNGQIEADD